MQAQKTSRRQHVLENVEAKRWWGESGARSAWNALGLERHPGGKRAWNERNGEHNHNQTKGIRAVAEVWRQRRAVVVLRRRVGRPRVERRNMHWTAANAAKVDRIQRPLSLLKSILSAMTDGPHENHELPQPGQRP